MILHNDFLYKFTHDGVRIYIVLLKDVVAQSVSIHHLSDDDAKTAGYVHTIASCMAAMRKENGASVCVCVKSPILYKKYTAIAEPDGRVRGRVDPFEPGIMKDNIILEVTQRLSIRGDYTSVVTGADIEKAVSEYFQISQQTIAKCAIRTLQDTYMCVLVEQFPITTPEEEVYRHAAEEEWQNLEPLLQAYKISNTDFIALDKYEEKAYTPLKFGCTCTRRSIVRALQMLTTDEKAKLADKDGFTSIQCKYCGKEYKVKVI